MGVAVLNDKIYAVGGFDGSTGLNSAEVSIFYPRTTCIIGNIRILILVYDRMGFFIMRP